LRVIGRSETMTSELELLRSEGVANNGVLTQSLNRPAKLNAIDEPLAQALFDALTAAMADHSVRAIVLRGEGRAFCAGRDITRAPTEHDLELVQAVAKTIVHGPKPVIAAVLGWVVGAGLEWVLATDIVIAADGARFKLPEAGIGVFVTGGVSATRAARRASASHRPPPGCGRHRSGLAFQARAQPDRPARLRSRGCGGVRRCKSS
jgi:enoyl-CoA hydratase/carnithine racemase